MLGNLFLLILFGPAAVIAGLWVLLLHLRPVEKQARGFPVVLLTGKLPDGPSQLTTKA